jgi:hypothetical protein
MRLRKAVAKPKSLLERKKDKNDPIAFPTFVLRSPSETKTPSYMRRKQRSSSSINSSSLTQQEINEIIDGLVSPMSWREKSSQLEDTDEFVEGYSDSNYGKKRSASLLFSSLTRAFSGFYSFLFPLLCMISLIFF